MVSEVPSINIFGITDSMSGSDRLIDMYVIPAEWTTEIINQCSTPIVEPRRIYGVNNKNEIIEFLKYERFEDNDIETIKKAGIKELLYNNYYPVTRFIINGVKVVTLTSIQLDGGPSKSHMAV